MWKIISNLSFSLTYFDLPTMMKIEGLVKVEVNTSAFTFNNCTYKERVDTQHFLNQWGGGRVGTICKRIIHWLCMFCLVVDTTLMKVVSTIKQNI
jgi:hypothetical protein